jgi:hypothetical protein
MRLVGFFTEDGQDGHVALDSGRRDQVPIKSDR